MTPEEITIDTLYSWPENDPGSLEPPRTGLELQVFQVADALVQEVSVKPRRFWHSYRNLADGRQERATGHRRNTRGCRVL